MLYLFWNKGHVALATTGLGKEKNIYISVFAPVTLIGGIDTSTNQGLRLHKLEWDFNNPLYPYQWILAIPTEESSDFGLSEEALFTWWSKINGEKFEFDFSNNNCKTMVIKALKIGITHSKTITDKLKTDLTACLENEDFTKFIDCFKSATLNTNTKIYRLLNTIDHIFNEIFTIGIKLEFLQCIFIKIHQLKSILSDTNEKVLLEKCVNDIFDITQNLLQITLSSTHLTIKNNENLENLIRTLTDLSDQTSVPPVILKKDCRKKIQSFLSCKFLFWSETIHPFNKEESLTTEINQRIISNKNPKKDFFHSRNTQISFTKM